MKILQGGAPKCGNFWLYQIIQQILIRSGRDAASFISKQPVYSIAKTWNLNYPSQASIDVLEITDLQYSYRISSVFRMPIEDISDYIAQTNHVWTHSPICKRSGEVLSMFDKKIYIIRDPRDRAISASKYYCSPYMLKYYPQEERDPEQFLQKNFEKLMHEWVWHVFDHLRLSNTYDIHICFYEGFLLDFRQELTHLLDYLEIDLSDNQKAAVEESVTFTALKEENPNHLKKGTSGYWMNQLPDEQIEIADIYAGPLILYLHYPEHRNAQVTFARKAPHYDFEKLKKAILDSQARLYQS